MLDTHSLLGFLAIAIIATLSPAPAVLLAISNGANHGMKKALCGIAGNECAMIFYASLAGLGMSTLLQSTGAWMIHAVQVIGGLYLCFLGVKALKSNVHTMTMEARNANSRSLFIQSTLVGLSNPKAILFFSALLPQFINPQANPMIQSFELTAIFASCSFIALTSYALLAHRLLVGQSKSWFNLINRLSGVLFMVFGGGLIVNGMRQR
ncbi:LysE family translocator [Vibrio sp. CAIM 722]|uniref:LysE family translocator n=1 Tax=Vibrio eleionomae TaxID=2653505 RepID=A0A7X4LLR4_9VIBR|nr:LysE family translocator [Vibrio eleionomae]MZI94121.1 LysE family translocator [Vibrio eleionomae]